MSEPDDFGAQAADGAQSRSGNGILSVLWRRKALVAFGGVVGLVVGILIYSQRPAVYQTTGQVIVIKKKPELMMQNGFMPNIMEDYVSSHLIIIKSPLIVERAVRKRNLQNLKCFAGLDATSTILINLVAARDVKDNTSGPNNIINLSYRGGVADECPQILNAIIESYQEFLTEAYQTVSDETYETLKKTRSTLADQLEEAQKDHYTFRKDNPDLILRPPNGPNEFLVDRANLKASYGKLTDQEGMINSQLTAMRIFKDKGLFGKLLFLMPLEPIDVQQRSFSGLFAMESRLNDLKGEQTNLIFDLGYGPGHPKVRAVQERINAQQAQLDKYTSQNKEVKSSPSEMDQEAPSNAVDKQEYKLRLELLQIENQKKSMLPLLAEAQKKATDIDLFEQKERTLLEKVNRLKLELGTVTTKLDDADRQRQNGGFDAKVLGKPGVGIKSSPVLYQFLLGGILLGLMVGLGLAYLMEAADKGFRTPEEIRRQLGLPVVGHIPLLTPDEEAVSRIAAGQHVPEPLLVCYYRPRSVEAEAYRAVRTALYFSVEGEGHKVIQVTSPNQGDGKSTLGANLAIAIAQSGKRVLMVDADCRRPRQHKVFGLVPTTGLANYLMGKSDLESGILPTMVENLSLLPCGPLPTNPAELLTSPRFAALLEELRQRYDFVLVDTPPLLAVTDPCVVAARVDGVLLTISMSRKARPQALRAREILATLGAKVLGVVVNRLDRESGSAYQSQSYGYGYGYSYEYTSSDSQAEMPASSGPAAPEERREA